MSCAGSGGEAQRIARRRRPRCKTEETTETLVTEETPVQDGGDHGDASHGGVPRSYRTELKYRFEPSHGAEISLRTLAYIARS